MNEENEAEGGAMPRAPRETEIAAMREANDRHNRASAKRRLMLIEKENGTWQVEDDTPTGVAPQSEYPDATKAAARALQLLGIKTPITPQSWPEQVCVGRVDYAGTPPVDPEWQA